MLIAFRDHRLTVMYQPAPYADPELYRPTYPPLSVRSLLGVLTAYLGLLTILSQSLVLALAALTCFVVATR
ncbi:hypothetical protein SAMN05443574_107105 [Haloarcula vallismortis]|uniref:Uncharacterized protein n=3 Tax=Haloarcula vallismortis TaxID=28442 RepID=M0JN89_HALVA|nr:hypothetical protein C437_06020 [Haloarcula vallismortis ATCC 29715]SDW82453.1 hypothetical protein SAMN05443574_107105 [Haloarcula vallismortis]